MKTIALAAILSIISQPLAAQDMLGEGCFLRAYTPDHLARHPDQQVTIIALRRADRHDTLGGSWVELSVGMRAWDEVVQGSALCDPVPAGAMTCQMEGDAGAFRLDPARGGALRLSIAARGVILEGTSDFALLSGTSGDDRVFLIPPVDPVACR